MESEVSFCFLEDNIDKSDACFFLEASEMLLKPNETKVINILLTQHFSQVNEYCLLL